MYSKEEMLQIYRDGHFKNAEFTDKFQQVPNATTPEFLIPLALLPIETEEEERRSEVQPFALAKRGWFEANVETNDERSPDSDAEPPYKRFRFASKPQAAIGRAKRKIDLENVEQRFERCSLRSRR